MITIIGAGRVGVATAVLLAGRGLDERILLLHTKYQVARGEALDISNMLSCTGSDVMVDGSSDPAEMAGSEIVVVAAGVAHRNSAESRMDLLSENIGMMRGIAAGIRTHAPDAVIMPVTNPLDPMTHALYMEGGFERSRVMGMGGLLDLARFRQLISNATGCSRGSVQAMVIGEHGENMLPLARYASVSGIPLLEMVSPDEAAQIVEVARDYAAMVIGYKFATSYGPGMAVADAVECVIRDRRQVIPACTPLDGEYGQSDVSLGVPVVAGRNGVHRIIELELLDHEKRVFEAGADGVRRALSGI